MPPPKAGNPGPAKDRLPATVLSVTGVEALYADMGHFGPQSIRYVWMMFVWPCLILNYLGSELLRKLDEVSVSFPGSVQLLNRGGHYLRGPSPEDEWGFMLGHERTLARSPTQSRPKTPTKRALARS